MNKMYFAFVLLLATALSATAQHWSQLINQPNANYFEVKKAFDAEWKDKAYEKGQGYVLFKRWEEFMLSHMDRNGNYNADAFNRAFAAWNDKNKNTISKTKGSAWEQIGPINPPGPYGYNNNGMGRMKEVVFHPTDTNIFYAGSQTGGVWKTTDAGNSYTYLSTSWSNNEVHGMSINPTNANELWICTNGYLYHTTNAGSTWQEISLSSSFASTGNFICNFSKGVMLISDYNKVVKYSTDGSVWTTVAGITTTINDFEINPGNASIVYAISTTALYKSTDGGKTFITVTTTGLTLGASNNRLAVSAIEPSSLWVLTIAANKIDNVYKSTDAGVSYTSILNKTTLIKSKSTTSTYSADAYFGGQGYMHASIGVSHKNTNKVFVGGVSLFYTEDAGANWYSAVDGWADQSPHVDNLNIRCHPITDVPYTCNDGGMYKGLKAPDAKGNYIWGILNNALAVTQMYDVSVSYDGLQILTSQQDNGTFLYDIPSKIWTFLKIGDGMANAFLPSDNKTVFIAHQNGSVVVSQNSGSSPITLLGSTSFSETSNFYTKIAVDPLADGVIYNLRTNLWVTKDFAKTWTDLTSTLTEDFKNGKFIVGYNNANTIALYDRTSNVYVTENGGTLWSKITVPTDAYGSVWVYNVALHTTNTNTLWISSDDGTIYYSENKGQTWTPYSTWPKLSVNKLMHVDGTTDELLIATSTGLYIKKNGSSVLEELAPGLPKLPVNDIEISYCTSEVYVATFGMGLWKAPITLLSGACCKKSPTLPAGFNNMICGNGRPIKITGNGTPYVWTYNSILQSITGDSLYATEGGTYSVKSKTQTCESATKNIGITDVRSVVTIPNCTTFETPETSDIIILRNNTTIPFTYYTNTTCTDKGASLFALRLSGLSSLYNASNDSAIFMLPSVNLTNATVASLVFDVASHFNSYSNAGTELEVEVSEDCGLTFKNVLSLKENAISIVQAGTDFIPASCNDWKNFSVNLSAYLGKEILIRFAIHSIVTTGSNFWGGNFYMDNICVNGTLTTTSTVTNNNSSIIELYPNPSFDILNVNSSETIIEMHVYDMQGRLMELRTRNNQVETKNLASGQYILKVTTDKGTSMLMFVKN